MPTRIDGVSSGGVYPAAGVTWAEATAAQHEMRSEASATRVRIMASHYRAPGFIPVTVM